MTFPSREFDDAVADLCHGTITDERLAGLHALLQSDPPARDEYLWQVELHSRLASTITAEQSDMAIRAVPPQRIQAAWVAAVALVVLVLAVGYVALIQDRAPGYGNDKLAQDVESGDGTLDGSPRQSGASGVMLGIPRQNVRFAYAANAPVIVGTGRLDPIHLGESVPFEENGNWLHVWNWSRSLVSRVYKVGLPAEDRFAVSPDGRWLVWSKGDVLDLETGERSTIDLGGANYFARGPDELLRRIQDMQFSPDGGRLALLISEIDVKPSDHPLRKWELVRNGIIQIVAFPSAELLCQFPASSWNLTGMRIGFSLDGARVVSEMPDRNPPRVAERDVASGEILRNYELDSYAYGIGISPDGRRIAACDMDAGLLVWNTDSGELMHRVADAGIMAGSTCVRFSPNSRYAAFRAEQHSREVIRVVDVQSGEIVATLPQWSVADIHWSPDGKTLTAITGHTYGDGGLSPLNNIYPTVDVWDWRAGTRIQSIPSE